MKNLLLTILAVIGLIMVLYFPVVGIITLCESDEEISDMIPLTVNDEVEKRTDDLENLLVFEENTDLQNFQEQDLKDNQLVNEANDFENIFADDISVVDAYNYESTILSEQNQEFIAYEELYSEENISDDFNNSSNKVDEDIVIVNGFSVKDSFDWHKERIMSGEITFVVIDKYDNVNYYLDYEQLKLEIFDDTNYKKEFELNPHGELVKYIYTEIK